MDSWHPSKLSLFLRLTGEIGRLDVLVEMATDELFHELGVWSEVEAYIVDGVQDRSVPPEQRLKALDALAFADIRAGSDRAVSWLDQMDTLIKAHKLGSEEQLRVGMKQMVLLAQKGDERSAMRLVSDLTPIVADLSPSHQRVFQYNIRVRRTRTRYCECRIPAGFTAHRGILRPDWANTGKSYGK